MIFPKLAKNTLFVEETEVTVQVERPQEERQASVIEGKGNALYIERYPGG